jgi:hypothetical protein
MVQAYSGVVMGTADYFTSPSLNERLATADMLAIHAVIDQVDGTSPVLTVIVETSGDQQNWIAKNDPTPEIDQALSAGVTNSFMGYELGEKPSSGYVRLRFQIAGTGSITGRVTLYVCGRTF